MNMSHVRNDQTQDVEQLTYLIYFFRAGQVPFQVICDFDEHVAQQILQQDTLWRGDGTYLAHRKRHERILRTKFIEKGGKPGRQHPIYMILGDSPTGPHDLHLEYDYKIVIPISVFSPEDVSFTYPDSLYEVPLDDLGKIYLERNETPTVYRLEELARIIETYRVYEYNHHYVEAQVWNDAPLKGFADPINWKEASKHER
jgi:hypothetical protein